ncbi:MAG: 1-acyl-sn-glycerol-3-phosphate acyltransferase [Alistipes sp.]|nr:1-acyl-sn-glycerol-3-phosphate acyltransferase [Alistipes sp.]
MKALKPRKMGVLHRMFHFYVDFINSRLYFRKVHTIGLENMPEDGTPVVLVSNHQNCLNDPIGLALALDDRKPHFLARANVFRNPVANRLLRGLGLLPAYRMAYEGRSAVGKNAETMNDVNEALLHGETVILYPECGHQDKRWLGTFSNAYLKMAFAAAEASGFDRDIYVMPTCNHYSTYFRARGQMLIKFGRPISIRPFYDDYKRNAHEAARKVNAFVRREIESLMLNIEDLDNYESLDYLRQSGFGEEYARRKGLSPDNLPERLLSDKELVERIEQAKRRSPEQAKHLFRLTRRLVAGIGELHIRDWLFDNTPTLMSQTLRLVGLLVGLPLFVASIIPTFLMYLVPRLMIKRMIRDKMFYSSINLAATVLITYPLCCLLPTVLLWIYAGWAYALIYFLAFPLMFIYSWNYISWVVKFIGCYRFISTRNRRKVRHLAALRRRIFTHLDQMLQSVGQCE